ncbi:AraC family ligand binding domain-containing protein [Gallaecimonas sp. GXIMD4217]|uniref:AraC family ligand binding domain-containing protein n=1 Tax=Gallaecimonas sp. GXIMD4217 TaxID=3131927 RepID=UPI00311B18DB
MAYLPVTLECRDLEQARLSARQRLPVPLLVQVVQGTGLVRLGKDYYQLLPGRLCWLPANVLFTLGAEAGARVRMAWFSSRLGLALPAQAGWLADGDWLGAVLDRAERAGGESRARLLRVLADELVDTKVSSLTQKLDWPATQGPLLPLAQIEAGRRGEHVDGLSLDPRPWRLNPA